MNPRRAHLLLIGSLTLLVVVGAAWVSVGGDRRVDLVGAAVTTTTSGAGTAALPMPLPTDPLPSDQDPAPTPTVVAALRPPGAAPDPAPGVPVKISIPSIGVDDRVVPVAFRPDGKMQVPGVDDAGWWEPGPRPGASHGSSVVAAHVDADGRPGVFRELQRLEVGSEVVVTDDAGTPRRYAVTERFQVAKGELPRAELFRTGGSHVLTLVTCGGVFDTDRRHYDDNIVVRAVPIPTI